MKYLALWPLLLFAGDVPRAESQLRVVPPQIAVGAFYNGADVRIEGTADAGSRVIVTITGSDREEHFKRKERFGPIWLSAEKLRISGVPSLFLRFATAPVAGLLRPDAIARLRLDAASLQARMQIEPPPRDRRDDSAIRSGYFSLKAAEGIYRFGDGGVVARAAGDCAPFTLAFRWPKNAPPGTYQVHVYEVRDGSVVHESSAPFSVVRTGFPAWLAVLAERRASLYGVVAVLFGALAGFGIDFLTSCIFGKKRTVSH